MIDLCSFFSYHICPSKQNFQFDTSFMFIIAVLNIIKIYQTRHPDINPRSSGSFSFLAVIILITVIGVVCLKDKKKILVIYFHCFFSFQQYYDEQWFWITYAIIHILSCLAFTGKIYYMGRLKVTFRVHVSQQQSTLNGIRCTLVRSKCSSIT